MGQLSGDGTKLGYEGRKEKDRLYVKAMLDRMTDGQTDGRIRLEAPIHT